MAALASQTGLTEMDLTALSKMVISTGRMDGDHHDKGHHRKGGKEGEVTQVPCNPDDLLAAINRANADDGANLELAHNCTYTLTANQDGNGLPIITQPITIKGNEATIVRAANGNEPAGFRIFNVGVGGNLTLKHLTVKGGKDTTGQGGGGILVQAGGTAKVVHSTITLNTTTTSGGGIANRGTTTVVNSTIANNSANVDGGAIDNLNGLLAIKEFETDKGPDG
jgi:hypothetical protein